MHCRVTDIAKELAAIPKRDCHCVRAPSMDLTGKRLHAHCSLYIRTDRFHVALQSILCFAGCCLFHTRCLESPWVLLHL